MNGAELTGHGLSSCNADRLARLLLESDDLAATLGDSKRFPESTALRLRGLESAGD
jgi:hypothetical protein